jgi:hypothetical protein
MKKQMTDNVIDTLMENIKFLVEAEFKVVNAEKTAALTNYETAKQENEKMRDVLKQIKQVVDSVNVE